MQIFRIRTKHIKKTRGCLTSRRQPLSIRAAIHRCGRDFRAGIRCKQRRILPKSVADRLIVGHAPDVVRRTRLGIGREIAAVVADRNAVILVIAGHGGGPMERIGPEVAEFIARILAAGQMPLGFARLNIVPPSTALAFAAHSPPSAAGRLPRR